MEGKKRGGDERGWEESGGSGEVRGMQCSKSSYLFSWLFNPVTSPSNFFSWEGVKSGDMKMRIKCE